MRYTIDRTNSPFTGWELGNINAAWFRLRPVFDAEFSELPLVLIDRALWNMTHYGLEIGAWGIGCSLNELMRAIEPLTRDYLSQHEAA